MMRTRVDIRFMSLALQDGAMGIRKQSNLIIGQKPGNATTKRS
jgi:hypothetical protein